MAEELNLNEMQNDMGEVSRDPFENLNKMQALGIGQHKTPFYRIFFIFYTRKIIL